MRNQSIFEVITTTLHENAHVVEEGFYIIEASKIHHDDHVPPRKPFKLGIMVKKVKETELHEIRSKNTAKRYFKDLIQQYKASLDGVRTLHVLFIPTSDTALGLALVIGEKDWQDITVKFRLKHLHLLPKKLEKKLKKCLNNPTNAKLWDDLHDFTDEMEELIQIISKFHQRLVNHLNQAKVFRDEVTARSFARNFILQLLITWHLHRMGMLRDKEKKKPLSCLITGRSLNSSPGNYHDATLKLLEQLHQQFQGKITVNENLLTMMRQVKIPNHFYHHEDFSREATIAPVMLNERILTKLGFIDLLQVIDWESLPEGFYFLGTLLEQSMEGITRKKTGTYYTPPHVAKYIVSRALSHFILEKINNNFNQTFSNLEEVLHEGSKNVITFFHQILCHIKILDPAMGSGHFLEAALEHLLELHEAVLNHLDDDSYILFHQDSAFLSSKVEENTPFLTRTMICRHIIQENLHGTDTNPDAIKIAKIRLMLKILTSLEPINTSPTSMNWPIFMNSLKFNLKTGNSLVGVHSIDYLMSLTKGSKFTSHRHQLDITPLLRSLQDLMQALQQEMGEPSIVILDELKILNDEEKFLSRKWFATWIAILNKVNALLKTRTDHEQRSVANRLPEVMHQLQLQLNQVLTRCMEIAVGVENLEITQPLHWVIEFPEIFHENQKTASPDVGFDLIVGNPPYIRQEEIGSLHDNFPYKRLLTRLHAPSDNKYDYSLYFVVRSMQLLKNCGWNAFIITDKWLRTIYGKSFRQLLKSHYTLHYIVDVSELSLFPRARVACLIYFLKNMPPPPDHHFTFEQHQLRSLSIPSRRHLIRQSLLPDDRPWTFLPSDLQEIMDWIFTVGTPLKELKVMIYYGIKTGYNKAFLIPTAVRNKLVNKNPRNAEIIVPIITGRCINRYHLSWNERWLILSKDGLNLSEHYPDVLAWLSQFKPTLKKRTDQGRYWFNLRPCRYYHEFQKPKITWKEIAMKPSFFYDASGLLTDATTFILTGPDATKALCAVLNSIVSWFAIQQLGTTLAPTTLRYKREYTFNLPICLPPKKEEFVFNVLVDAVQFLKAIAPSKASREWQDALFLETVLDVLVFELYFGEKLETLSNHAGKTFRSLVGNACQSVTLDVDRWFAHYWKCRTVNDDKNKEEETQLRHLGQHNAKEISSLILLLKEDDNIQSLYQLLQRDENYEKLRATMSGMTT